jgi:hypothetical protein
LEPESTSFGAEDKGLYKIATARRGALRVSNHHDCTRE